MTLANHHETVLGVLGVEFNDTVLVGGGLAFVVGTFLPLVLSVWRGTKVGVVAAVLWGLVGLAFMAGEIGTALVVFLAPALIGVGVVAAIRGLRRSRSQS